jgi:hypothetical protein
MQGNVSDSVCCDLHYTLLPKAWVDAASLDREILKLRKEYKI